MTALMIVVSLSLFYLIATRKAPKMANVKTLQGDVVEDTRTEEEIEAAEQLEQQQLDEEQAFEKSKLLNRNLRALIRKMRDSIQMQVP